MKRLGIAGIALLLLTLVLSQACVYIGPPQVASFQATPENISPGQAVTISWVVTGATSVNISPDLGSLPLTGSRQVSPTQTTVYTLTAGNTLGTSSASLTITVATQPGNIAQPVILAFNASPYNISNGGSSVLSWIVNGADSVRIEPGIGDVSPASSRTVFPAATTTYTLTAVNQAGTVFTSVTIVVGGGAVTPGSQPVIIFFKIYPPRVFFGYPAVLEWNVSGADSVFIDQGVGVVEPYGSKFIYPPASQTYVLTAQNSSGQVNANASVSVINGAAPNFSYLPQINYFTLSPSSISPGGSATLRWSVNNATSVFIDHGIGFVQPSGTITVTPTETTWYTLTASNGYGSNAGVTVVGVNKQ